MIAIEVWKMDVPLQILWNNSPEEQVELQHHKSLTQTGQNRIIKFEGRRELMYLPLKHTVPFQNKNYLDLKLIKFFCCFHQSMASQMKCNMSEHCPSRQYPFSKSQSKQTQAQQSGLLLFGAPGYQLVYSNASNGSVEAHSH